MAFADVQRQAASPSSVPHGIGGDANTIWHNDYSSDQIYELDTSDLSVIRQAASPSSSLTGIGGDANTIWHNDTSSDQIYELDTSDLSVIRQASSPSGDPSGIGGDANTIWHNDYSSDKVYELDTSDLSVIRQAASPSSSPSGIGGDANTIWHNDFSSDKVYELDTSDLSVIRQAASPSSTNTGIGGDANTIWHNDTSSDQIYELDADNNQPQTATFTATVTSGDVAATLTDYPAYIDLSEMPASFWSTVVNGGGDIRVYSDEALTTELAREVVSADTSTDTGELHVKIPSLTTSTVIYITVDGTSSEPAAGSTYGSEAVWSYNGVWHLKETSGNTTDSTSNANTLTDNNTVGTATGKIGIGRDFELSNSEYFSITDNSSLSIVGDISFSGWIKLEQLPSTAGSSMQIQVKDDTSGSRSYAFYINSNDKLVLLYFDGSSNLTRSISDSAIVVGGDVGNLVHLVGTADVSAKTITFYKNGSSVASTNDFSYASSIRDGSSDFRIGARSIAGSASEFFDGVMDEQRIYSGILSADWTTTEYNNQSDVAGFWTIAEAATTPTATARRSHLMSM